MAPAEGIASPSCGSAWALELYLGAWDGAENPRPCPRGQGPARRWGGWRGLRTMQELPPIPWVKIAFPLPSRRLFPVTRTKQPVLGAAAFWGGGKGMVSAQPGLSSGGGQCGGPGWSSAILMLFKAVKR